MEGPQNMVSKNTIEQVILLLADGARADIMQELLNDGELPGISRTFCHNREKVIDTGVTTFPSTTGPAHLPFLTGLFPGACNIPGIRWFDPEAYWKKRISPNRFRSYMGVGNFFLGSDINPEIRTIFQEIRDHRVIASSVHRGVRFGRNLTLVSKIVQNIKSFITQDWKGLDHIAEKKLLKAAIVRTPLIFAAFYGTDSNGHKQGPYGDKVLDAYRRLDRTVGHLGDELRRHHQEEKTLICLFSDHGMSQTDTHIDLHALINKIYGPCLAHPQIWQGYFSARSAVMVSGNAMAHIYISNNNRWDQQYLDNPGEQLTAVIHALLQTTGIDQVAGKCSDGSIRVYARNGRATIAEMEAGRIMYTSQGDDPFNYPESLRGCYADGELLDITFSTKYPDAPRQLLQLFKSPRCGHLVVTAATGYDLRARYEYPTHVGSHGSLHRQHMIVPMMFNKTVRKGAKRTADVFPTAMAALGHVPHPDIDGKSLFL